MVRYETRRNFRELRQREVLRILLLRASVNRVCTRRHLRLRTLVGSGVAHSGILKNRKVRHSYAQTNSRGRQRNVLPGGSGRGHGPDPVVVDRLAGTRALALLGAYASARSDTARCRTYHADSGVRAFRHGGPRDTGTDRRARASGRRRGVSLRPQPHVCRRTGGHRWAGVTLGLARSATVRCGGLAGRRGVRSLVRGTHPHPPVRRGLRGLPERGARLVATPASLETQRARRTRG